MDYLCNTGDLNEDSKTQLRTLNIPDEALTQFENDLTQKYGAQFAEDASFIQLVRIKLHLQPKSKEPSFHYHILLLDGLVGFYQMLVKSESAKVSQLGMFAQTQTTTNEDSNPDECQEKSTTPNFETF